VRLCIASTVSFFLDWGTGRFTGKTGLICVTERGHDHADLMKYPGAGLQRINEAETSWCRTITEQTPFCCKQMISRRRARSSSAFCILFRDLLSNLFCYGFWTSVFERAKGTVLTVEEKTILVAKQSSCFPALIWLLLLFLL